MVMYSVQSNDAVTTAISESLKRLAHLRVYPSEVMFKNPARIRNVGGVEAGIWRPLRSFAGQRTYAVAIRTLYSGSGWDRGERLQSIAACLAELEVHSRLRHENIAPLVGLYVRDDYGVAWSLTPWHTSQNLSQYIQTQSAALTLCLQLLADSASSLAYLHSLQPPVYHGDVKPENYLISGQGRAMLSGFASSGFADGTLSDLTRNQKVGPTLHYSSPEAISTPGSRRYLLERDVWAWGCTCLVILTGRQPYEEQTSHVKLVNAISRGESPARLDTLEVPGLVRVLLSKCWAQEPQDRYTMVAIDEAVSTYNKTAVSMPSLPHRTLQRHAQNLAQEIDYARLERTLRNTLTSLSHLQFDHSRIQAGPLVASTDLARVYKGSLRRGDSLQVPVAIKKLQPYGDRNTCIRVAAALVKELRAWWHVQPPHSNILPITGYYLDTGGFQSAWLIAPWQQNGDLEAYLHERKPDPVRRLELAKDTASGLMYLHGLPTSLSHGDIKPANTLISDAGKAMLCDFGLARLADSEKIGLTTGDFSCTLRYISPEAESEGCVTPASDVWAWGSLLLYTLTNRHPYHWARSDVDICKALVARKAPADLQEGLGVGSPEIEATFIELMKKCWDLSPKMRPNMLACRRTLEDIGLSEPDAGAAEADKAAPYWTKWNRSRFADRPS